ncbi:FMN-binding negative transcriptional regulator [Cellulomonas hominis]
MIHTSDYELHDESRVRDIVRAHGWATLVTHTDDGLVASHVPVLLEEPAGDDDAEGAEEDRGLVVVSHLGRPDEVAHQLDGARESLLIVEGPYGYVSPGWYGYRPAVPTWNYVAVHLYGTVELLDAEESYRVLGATVERYESVMPDPVLMPDVEGYAQRIAPGAVGLRMRVRRWQGKTKLSQDKPRAVAERVVAALETDPHYADPALAAEMRAELARREDWV